jgi:alpha/beta hydrolase fold
VLNVGLVFPHAQEDEAIRASDPVWRRRFGPRPHEARICLDGQTTFGAVASAKPGQARARGPTISPGPGAASATKGRREETFMATRPAWVSDKLFPFQSHFLEVDGAQVHYIDEGQGPVFLGLHGNPTWSFLYRHIVSGLKDRFRCIAPDYPGFGLSTAPDGYRYTIAEHARTLEGFIEQLDLRDITMMV